MRKDEYRKYLDRITCTEEFRSRMEVMLSAEADGEYADSVSTVERAGMINYHRWTAIAASAVLMVGIGGVMLHTIKNAPDVPGSSLSDTTGTTESSVIGSDKVEIGEMNLTIDSGQGSYSEKWGVIPKEASDAIIEKLKTALWEREDDKKYFNYRSDEEYIINIDCTGTDSFTYSIGANGYSYISFNGEESYFNNGTETYYDIVEIIAGNIPFCDWNHLLSSHGAEVDAVFKEHKDEIKRITSLVDSFDTWIPLFNNGLYSVEMDSYGKIKVYYRNQSGGEDMIYFESSAEMAQKLAKILGEDFEAESTEATTQPTDMTINGKLESFLDNPDFIENGNLSYHTGGGQFSSSYNIGKVGEVGGEEFIKLLANYEWKPSEDIDYIRSDFIMIGYNYSDSDLMGVSISVNDKGELYDHSEGVLYRAENADIAELEEAYESTAIADYYTATAYSLSTRGDDFTTLESDISIYYDPLDETGENKPVKCTGKMYYKNITYGETKDCYGDYYYILSDAESGYSGEMYKQGRNWSFIERGNSIAIGEYGKNVFALEDAEDFSAGYFIQRDNYTLTGGNANFHTINIDYDMLCEEALYTLIRRNEDYMNVLDEELIVGQFSNYFKLEYNNINGNSEENKKYSEILEFRVKDSGELIYFSKSRRNLETGEVTPYLTFQMCDGICNSMGDYVPILDNPDFAIPRPCEELMKEFELKYGA